MVQQKVVGQEEVVQVGVAQEVVVLAAQGVVLVLMLREYFS